MGWTASPDVLRAGNNTVGIPSEPSMLTLLWPRALIFEYVESLDFSLCFQSFDAEMDIFLGSYGPLEGCLLIGLLGAEPGCAVGLRPISAADGAVFAR